jgi:UDP-glucose 4-epimerase
MAVCLVTGGGGFIGTHLVDALLDAGHEVRVLDNWISGSRAKLAHVRDRIQILTGDVTDAVVVCQAVKGVEIIFHQAAAASVPRSVADPLNSHHVCATGTLQLLMAAQGAGVQRVVYAASFSAYGNPAKLPVRESDPTQPLSPDAVAKLAGENYCWSFSQVYGLETVRLRYFNVFGPGQLPSGPYAAVIPLFIEAILSGRSPVVYGDGLQSRDFTYVDDVVQANLLAAQAPRVAGKVFNIASGRRTAVLDLVEKINQITGAHVRPVHDKPRSADIRHSQADISLAQAELGYCPCTDLERDLRYCLEYHAELRQEPLPFPGSQDADEREFHSVKVS